MEVVTEYDRTLRMEKEMSDLLEITREMNKLVHTQGIRLERICEVVENAECKIENGTADLKRVAAYHKYGFIIRGTLVLGTTALVLSPCGITLKLTLVAVSYGLISFF